MYAFDINYNTACLRYLQLLSRRLYCYVFTFFKRFKYEFVDCKGNNNNNENKINNKGLDQFFIVRTILCVTVQT